MKERTYYEAIDGVQFENKEKCLNYEDDILALSEVKFLGLVVGKFNLQDMWTIPNTSSYVKAVKMEKESDKEIVEQYLYWRALNNEGDFNNKTDPQIIEEAFNKKDLLFIYFDEDDEWSNIIGTRNGIMEKLKAL